MKRTNVVALCILVLASAWSANVLGVGGDSCPAATPIVIPVCDGTPLVDTPLMMATATASGFALASCFSDGTVDNDRWYSWANGTGVPQDLVVTTDLPPNAGGDSQIAIFDDCVPTTELGCDDDSGTVSAFLSTAGATVPPGATAMIQLDGWSGDTAFDTVEFGCTPVPLPPPNDACAMAAPISTCTTSPVYSGPFPFDNTAATADGDQTHAACDVFGTMAIDLDVWFCWTAEFSGDTVTAETCGLSAVDTKMAAYGPFTDCPAAIAACPPADPALLDCVDDSCAAQSSVTFATPLAGEAYLIRVGTFPGAAGGVGAVDITCTVPVGLQSFSVE